MDDLGTVIVGAFIANAMTAAFIYGAVRLWNVQHGRDADWLPILAVLVPLAFAGMFVIGLD